MKWIDGLAGAGLCAAIGLLAPASSAETWMMAQNGVPVSSSDASCWSAAYGTMTNTCSSTKELDFPMTGGITNGGTSIWVFAGSGSSQFASCQLLSVCADDTCANSGTIVAATGSTHTQKIDLTVTPVNAAQKLFFAACWMGPQSRVNSYGF